MNATVEPRGPRMLYAGGSGTKTLILETLLFSLSEPSEEERLLKKVLAYKYLRPAKFIH